MKNHKNYISIIVVIFFILIFVPNIFAAKLVPSFPNSSALQPIPLNISPEAHNININVNNQNNNFSQQPVSQQIVNNTKTTGRTLLKNINMIVGWLIFALVILMGIFAWLRLRKKHTL